MDSIKSLHTDIILISREVDTFLLKEGFAQGHFAIADRKMKSRGSCGSVLLTTSGRGAGGID